MTQVEQARRRPGRPRGATPGRTAEALVESASVVFGDNGFRGASLAQVAERAGVTQAGLLHHFPTKKALLAAVLRRRDEVDQAQLDSVGGEERVGFDALEDLVVLAGVNATKPGMVRLYATMAGEAIESDHPGNDWLREHVAGAEARIVELLERGVAAGQVREDLPAQDVARALIAVMDGLQVQWLLSPGSVDMAAGVRLVLDALRARWEVPGHG